MQAVRKLSFKKMIFILRGIGSSRTYLRSNTKLGDLMFAILLVYVFSSASTKMVINLNIANDYTLILFNLI